MKAAEKNVKRKAHYDHLEQSVDAEAAKRFREPTYSQRIPHYVKQVYEQLELAAGLSGFEIVVLFVGVIHLRTLFCHASS